MTMYRKKVWNSLGIFLLLTTLFALGYNQSPLYTSNQYQYFLHGLAHAGVGTLAEDWLANTLDPTPLFSLIVEATARLQALWLNYIFYGLLMGIYLFSLVSIADTFFHVRKTRLALHGFLAGIFLFHSAGLRFLLSQGLGPDWIYLFEGGVAGQRLLGPVFQPSTFGVFLQLSLALHLRGRTVWAILAAVFAATLHPTYLLSAGVLVLTYLVDLFLVRRRKKEALWMGILALAAVAPILGYTILSFVGGSPETAARAGDILVNIRIPHHAVPAEWFNATVVFKLLLLGSALLLVRRSRLILFIALPLGISLSLTILQVVTGNQTLALLFPWRLSTWLVPLSLAMLVARLANLVASHLPLRFERILQLTCILLISLSVFAGIARTLLEAGEAELSPSRDLQEYVALHRQPGETYLVPIKMYDFRLIAGAPVYADSFAIPYQNDEVVAWYSRMIHAQNFYTQADCSLLEELGSEGVTHVVLPANFPGTCPSLIPVYADDTYRLFRLVLK